MADNGMLQNLDPAIIEYLKEINADPSRLDVRELRYQQEARRRQQEDDAYRAQLRAEGDLAQQHLWDILHGAQPRRDLFTRGVPPSPPLMPPVAVPPTQQLRPQGMLQQRVNGAPVFNPNPSYTPTGGGVRG